MSVPTTLASGATHELPGPGRALFTSRAHGNLSSVGGEASQHGLRARERLRERIAVDCLVRGYQVHGSTIGRVRGDGWHIERELQARELREDSTQPSFHADGHAIAAPRVAAMVMAADCVPVVLGTPSAVAAIHAGWRGLAAGVLEHGVLTLRELATGALEHGVLAQRQLDGDGEIVAIVGPCAGACCYEVGEEVHKAFGDSYRRDRTIDLRAIAEDRLLGAGVGEVRHERACTICDERYFSYRREGDRAGRQAGLAWLS